MLKWLVLLLEQDLTQLWKEADNKTSLSQLSGQGRALCFPFLVISVVNTPSSLVPGAKNYRCEFNFNQRNKLFV